jgi:hypothetical protein
MDSNVFSIDGFDPLSATAEISDASYLAVVEEASKRIVHNILKSYTGYFDVFSELLQNSLDAVQFRERLDGSNYTPRVWITIDIPAGIVRVVDNGSAMDEREFKYCLRPNVSFKRQADLRGHKGVGATFLAYGFSFFKLQSRKSGTELAAVIRQGRQWAEDASGTVPRPKFEAVPFGVPELLGEKSGTSAEVIVGQSSGERPRNLGWIGAQSAEQWLQVLRIKTPLGGIYLSSAGRPKISVNVRVRSAEGTETTVSTDSSEYFYPHEIENLKTQALSDIVNGLAKIQGDAATKFAKLPPEFKKLDCIWDVWSKDQILDESSYFASALNEESRTLIEKHNVVVYGCFLRSAKIWGEVNDEVLKLRKGQRLIHGGLQLASDFMPQGDLMIIPLTSTIGYQANSHVVVHFTDGSPDLGRKAFQPELKDLGEALSVRVVNVFKRFLTHLKPDTGAQAITPDRELYDWKKEQEEYRNKNPLGFEHLGRAIAIVSEPRQEQDAVALFHELLGLGIVKGYRIFATSQSDRYDSLFVWDYHASEKLMFDPKTNRLGVTRDLADSGLSEPKVLEYKYSFDSLISDFEKEIKFAKQIDLVVCWTAGKAFKEKFFFQSLLVGDEGSSRTCYAATHHAYSVGAPDRPAFEVIVLEDLLAWLQNPGDEEARQRSKYKD